MTPEEMAQQEAFDQGTKVAQIFSGIFFSGLAGWLTVTNGTSLAFVQRAALEKRLTVCCFLNTYVGVFSAFFNIFQLTDVDDMLLPHQGQFVLDLSRPIEWVLTCPLMQLVLVLMGGAKIPEHRRYMMPGFSVFILSCGTASTFMPNMGLRVTCYAIGLTAFGFMVFFNRLQIIEYSGGDEGLISGDSEFRKATMLLISTWFPFPMWFIMSPEGFGFIDNVLIIQVGWAFLNIVAKFVFIFYIQRIKDLYCNRLKTKRELTGNKSGPAHRKNGAQSPIADDLAANDYDSAQAYEQAEVERKKGQLSAVVVETMSFLGMAQHTARFLKLLENAEISTIDMVEDLTKDQCEKLQLPFDLVSALQRRLRVWKLEMVDDAEMGLDKGEEFYIKKGLDDVPRGAGYANVVPGYMSAQMMQMGMQNQMMWSPQISPGAETPELPGAPVHAYNGGADVLRSQRESQACFEQLLQKTEEQKTQVEGTIQSVTSVVTAIQEKMESMEKRLTKQMEGSTKTGEQRSELRAMETRISNKLDDMVKTTELRQELHSIATRVNNAMEQQMSLLTAKVDMCCKRVDACGQNVDVCSQKVDTCSQKVDICKQDLDGLNEKAGQAKSSSELLNQRVEAVAAKLDEVAGQSKSGFETVLARAEKLQTAQAKAAAEAENGWRQKFEEFENNMTCREDENESALKRRHEELLRASAGKRLEELAQQVQRVGDRSEAAVTSLGTTLSGELHTATAQLGSKVEGVHKAAQESTSQTARAAQDALNAYLQRRFDKVEEVATQAATQAATQGAAQAAQGAVRAVEALDGGLQKRLDDATARAALRTEKAVESLDSGLQKRLDEAMLRAATEGAHQGTSHTERRAEKAIESLETSQRNELHAALSNLLERVDDVQTVQARKAAEREDRNTRRLEELMEVTSNKSLQKTEDMGLDLKKELHGFAKRLNSKIPFM